MQADNSFSPDILWNTYEIIAPYYDNGKETISKCGKNCTFFFMSDYKQVIKKNDICYDSQGIYVFVILLNILIEENIIKANRPVCKLFIAKISHGPFPTRNKNLLVKSIAYLLIKID